MNSIVFWNYRGARKVLASLYLKEFVKQYGVGFIGLLETKVSSMNRKDIIALIGMDWNCFHYPSEGLSGGTLILWNTRFAFFNALFSSCQCVIGDLKIHNKELWKISTVYANKDSYKRRDLWNQLEKYMLLDSPSVVGGDFNCLLSKGDKKGGRGFEFSQGSKEMKYFFANLDYHELSFIGPRYTWCNNKLGGAQILERLDRCFVNSSALESNSLLVVHHLPRIASDHCPIMMKLWEDQLKPNVYIKFKDTWASHYASAAIVQKAWNKNIANHHLDRLHIKFKKGFESSIFLEKIVIERPQYCEGKSYQRNTRSSNGRVFGWQPS
ncbi:uncharacterized protein LOC110101207 [Dendrobium catenatum]|uniref:uncharacterized protein LOC110101207 n=1 Tax=Dendrobium catenatum TaxID=906689 RepID=UPI0009F6F099|nr:uncharacterized protein LOC110101207 [Dendrobium catenatum]